MDRPSLSIVLPATFTVEFDALRDIGFKGFGIMLEFRAGCIMGVAAEDAGAAELEYGCALCRCPCSDFAASAACHHSQGRAHYPF